jgi:methylamine utilization protein MauE
MHKLFRILFIILSVAVGATFLYSAYTKLYPIRSFEYTMSEFIHLPPIVAAIAARFFTGLEAALGALIIFHLFGKNKWVLKSAFALLITFSVYLLWLWATAGNNVNCGCFGDAIWMSPFASLIKNAVLLAIIGVIIRYHHGFDFKWSRMSAPVSLACIIAIPFFVFPIQNRYRMDFKPLYTADSTNVPPLDLSRGKHIIAFLSPSCIHCRKAALKIHEMKLRNPSLPIYMVIGGTKSDLTDFWKASNAQDVPHSRLPQEPFMKYTGGIFPTILWVNNGMVEANTGYPELDQKVIEKWMK